MLKYIAIIVLVVLVASCGKSKGKTRPAHYTLTDIRTATFLQYLAENDTTQLPYFEKQIMEELKNVEWQNAVFEENFYDSICHFLLSPLEIYGIFAPIIKMRGFGVLIDSNGALSHDAKYTVLENMVNKYWRYYRPSGIKSLYFGDRADVKLELIPDVGKYLRSKGYLQIGIMLSESDASKRKALRSLRNLFRGLYSKLIQYRYNLSNEFFEEDFSQLSKSDWSMIVSLTQFYCEIQLFYFKSNESEENFRRFY